MEIFLMALGPACVLAFIAYCSGYDRGANARKPAPGCRRIDLNEKESEILREAMALVTSKRAGEYYENHPGKLFTQSPEFDVHWELGKKAHGSPWY